MPTEISVGPPVLTVNQGSTFMVTDLDGSIEADSEMGLFAEDTRFVSHWRVSANGMPWQRVTSSAIAYNACRVYLTNPAFPTEAGDVPEASLVLTITRVVGEGVHEHLDLTNHGSGPVHLNLEIALRSDFADLFEVKAHRFVRRGRIVTEWRQEPGALHASYTNGDFHRELVYALRPDGSPPHYANGRITCEVALAPAGRWRGCCDYSLSNGARMRASRCPGDEDLGATDLDSLQHQWLEQATSLTSANEDVYRFYQQSVADMGALRLHEHDLGPDVWLPAAGVPWFVTVFGRDSLLVSLQNMLVNAGFARGALEVLGRLQATEIDDWRDAEPGKIPHEMRYGELAHFKRVPHTPYYGTADATPLYLIVLHEAWKWLGDEALLRDHRDVALGCLEWIDRYGDLDGDGFQEYRTRSKAGYENMGWKDAGDAIVYPDGSQVGTPKALCELQGYVFDAWMRSAEVFDALGEQSRALELRAKAADLRARFEAAFWCEDAGFYALTLDAAKEPVPTIASNAGHCLWSGIASADHAALVVRRLLEADMWSGWGIRTLSAANPAYNPFSYQCGSVWPHDNGIIALGMKRYGFADEAARVARDISEAASYFLGHRLPELYAGIERRPGGFPVQYRGANVPQAWAAGTAFHLLQALLGIQADAPAGVLNIDPVLPAWMPDVSLQGLRVGDASVDLHVWRDDEATRWDAHVQSGQIDVRQHAWQPW
jgi:glycogen debranching enzyme